MRDFDFSPLFRSAIGFDRLPSLVDSALRGSVAADAYPPYNIQKVAEDAYCVSIAVAGFAEADLSVEVRDGVLVVTGQRKGADEGVSYLHRGIAGRSFVRRFQLAEHVEVRNAALADGMLTINLVREVPEALKPRTIEIRSTAPTAIGAPKAA